MLEKPTFSMNIPSADDQIQFTVAAFHRAANKKEVVKKS